MDTFVAVCHIDSGQVVVGPWTNEVDIDIMLGRGTFHASDEDFLASFED